MKKKKNIIYTIVIVLLSSGYFIINRYSSYKDGKDAEIEYMERINKEFKFIKKRDSISSIILYVIPPKLRYDSSERVDIVLRNTQKIWFRTDRKGSSSEIYTILQPGDSLSKQQDEDTLHIYSSDKESKYRLNFEKE